MKIISIFNLKKKTKENYRQLLIDKIEGVVEQKEVTIGTLKTTYLLSGNGKPVILLHGAGAGAVTWYPSINTISKNFQVIAPDIVGYGESDKPDAPYNRPYFSNWLKDFMKELGISKAHIVGLSQGGAIALQFAIDNAAMVDKLVVVDAAGLGAKVSFWPLLGTIWMNSFPSAMANRFNSRYILHKPVNRDPNHSSYSIAVLKYKGGQNAFKQGRGTAVSKIPEEALKQIKNETLIIWGKEDQLFPVAYGEAAAQIIPKAKLNIIQEAGHLPLMDQPELFNTILEDFLKSE
ncbi:alpha/beta fold hydrolase [Flavobacterium sp.]|uniref:alpha/beta fold hydrolase n=1 Tax=Flavobacterium sp. TaxID=239 RepID=UPI002FDAD57F